MKKEKSELEQIKEWKRSLLLEGKMIQDIDEWNSLVEERNDLLEENKKLKSDLAFERTMLDNVSAEYKSLQNVIKKLEEELAHYKNTEAIQKSNAASRYNPYNHKSYVDREFNVIP